MHIKILGIFGAVLLVVGCESVSDTGSMSDAETMTVTESMVFAEDSQDYLDVNIGSTVYFDFNKYNIRSDYAPVLEAQAEWMKQNPMVRVSIGGHCDERGTREYNLALGNRRANAVKDFLVAAGIDAERILTISYGKERPAVVGNTEAAYAANRRAVTMVQ